ncbi:MAG: amidohydrolase family protein [Ilumatobacteraceae bacterium]
MSTSTVSDDRITIISTDGHATAPMADYRPYLDERFRDDFDAFLVEWDEHGTHSYDLPALRVRLSPESVEEWRVKVLDAGRAKGGTDATHRVAIMDQEGIAAEVTFPDFGLPFELYSPQLAAMLGRTLPSVEQVDAAHRAYNRWLVDFQSVAPHRFASMAIVRFGDVAATIGELERIADAGLKGLVLSKFSPQEPLYSARFDPVWSAIEDLDLIVNSHIAISSVSDVPISMPNSPHPAIAGRLFGHRLQFECREVLSHLIWGGVFERHPRLRVVLTEQGSGWIVRYLADADFSYKGSYARDDVRDYLRSTPSEYFDRHVHLGSSSFSRAEVEARHLIGIDRMMIGMDYPHHESTLQEGTRNYLRATFGAVGVPLDEAQRMLGGTAADVFGFDLGRLSAEGSIPAADVLTPPVADLYPLGDVKKPLV